MNDLKRSRLAQRPDLNECLLEDRVLMAYSPTVPGTILTTGGYIVLSTPPGLNSNISTGPSSGPGSSSSGGSSGGNGGNLPTSFSISGFGGSTFAIGNNTGFPSLSAQSKTSAASGGGGGGGDSSPAPAPPKNAGFGSSFSSGYSTSLDSSNNYGISTTPVGSIPVHTYADRGEETVPQPAPDYNTPVVIPGMNQNGSPMGGTPLWNNLIGKPPGRSTLTPSIPGQGNP